MRRTDLRLPPARRLVAGVLAALAVAPAGAAGSTGAGNGSGSGSGSGSGPGGLPVAALQGFRCTAALDPAGRSISVQAVMRPVSGTEAMAVRVQLLERIGSARPVDVVRAGDLDTWISPSEPGLGQRPGDVWRLDKTVVNLPAATYRFRVVFRWTGSGGTVLSRVVLTSRSCRERELRPNLSVRSIAVSAVAGDPAHEQYAAVLANDGLTAAGPFEVLFAPNDGSGSQTVGIIRLAPGRSRTLTFTGPVCNPSAPPTVTADAARQVDDLDRSDNTVAAVCPPHPGD